MLRRLTLSLLMFVSVVVISPFADSAAHGLRQSVSMYRSHHRHHSRRWWRRHRALVRARRAARAHRDAPLMARPEVSDSMGNVPPSALSQTPSGWSARATANGQIRFQPTAASDGPGKASLAVIALSRPTPAFLTMKEQRQMLGGVPFAELRRIVIDKMITSGGWVTNDFEREVGGRRVLIITAQTPADGRSTDKAWNFYFTEVNGRIYSLTTEAPLQSAERMAAEAERFIASLN